MSLTKVYTALKRMRELSDANIPFSFSFQPYSEKRNQAGSTIKVVNKALLRQGYTSKQSNKSESLIAYYDLEEDKPRFCHLPLILTFNDNDLR